tara:strand:+ start:1660 stop:1908 length:249 start_codon:yes stop_codon:yes gene_type:complete
MPIRRSLRDTVDGEEYLRSTSEMIEVIMELPEFLKHNKVKIREEFKNKVKSLMEYVDSVKNDMPEGVYIELCKKMMEMWVEI